MVQDLMSRLRRSDNTFATPLGALPQAVAFRTFGAFQNQRGLNRFILTLSSLIFLS
jgi:hypothetical protein